MSVGLRVSDAGVAVSAAEQSNVTVFLSPRLRAAVEPLREHVETLFQNADDALADLQQQLTAALQHG